MMLSDKVMDVISDTIRGYGRGADGGTLALWEEDLEGFTDEQILLALRAYRQSGADRAPTQGQIRELIVGDDGRPTAEEAWGIVVQILGNEDKSACLTAEMTEPWGLASNVWPDEVGARMTFKDAYNRAVRNGRAAKQQVQWWIAAGLDPHDNARVRLAAIADGRIARAHGLAALPASTAQQPDDIDAARDRLLVDSERAAQGLPLLSDGQHRERWNLKKREGFERLEELKRELSQGLSAPRIKDSTGTERKYELNQPVSTSTLDYLREVPKTWAIPDNVVLFPNIDGAGDESGAAFHFGD